MNNKIIFNCILTTALSALILAPASAGVYRWVDQNGQVHYGDKPGKKDAEIVPIRKHKAIPQPSNKTGKNGNEQSQGDSRNRQKNDKAGNQPATAKKPARNPEISKTEKSRLCNEARNDIAAINSRGRAREKNAKGEYHYLSESERQKRLAAAKKKQRKYCR